MECKLNIEVHEPKSRNELFRPYVSFRFEQLNFTSDCMTDKEIDEQVNMLIKEVETLRKKAKQTLKGAKARSEELLRKARAGS